MRKLTREWVQKAETDRLVAEAISDLVPAVHDAVCFHSQQCAEKYLKALLQEFGLPVPRTHDLDMLLTLLRPHHPSLQSLRRGLTFLSEFAVDVRYPRRRTKKRQAVAALRWANRVRDACRTLLGIRLP
jgi:HEPN domain-containing protein